MIYAHRAGVTTEPKASRGERSRALWPLGFPVMIIGGIYGGVFSPTEAAAACVLYAPILEVAIFREKNHTQVWDTAKSTRLLTAVVFTLVGAGAAFSWVTSFAQISPAVLDGIGISAMGPIGALFVISIAFFVGCMFVDPIVVILVLAAIFAPVVDQVGLDPVLVGAVNTLLVAIGSAKPPFGCDIFTAIAVFKRPYPEVVRGTPPFIAILLSVAIAMIFVPDIALFLRDLSFDK